MEFIDFFTNFEKFNKEIVTGLELEITFSYKKQFCLQLEL